MRCPALRRWIVTKCYCNPEQMVTSSQKLWNLRRGQFMVMNLTMSLVCALDSSLYVGSIPHPIVRRNYMNLVAPTFYGWYIANTKRERRRQTPVDGGLCAR